MNRTTQHSRSSLADWKASQPSNSAPCGRDWVQPSDSGKQSSDVDKAPTLLWFETAAEAQKALQRELQWKLSHRLPAVPEVRCQVVELGTVDAVLKVWMDGYELPRVGFPAAALRQHSLGVGGRFIWRMRGGQPSARDVDPDVPQGDGLTAAELAELQTLEQRYAVGSGVGLTFIERTGDGR